MNQPKRTSLLSAGLLAVAAVALLAPSAKAQTVYTAGDLLLGFELPGNANDVVVDLGPATYYTGLAATPGVTNITTSQNLGNLAGLLSSTFGASWATNNATQGTNVQWGVIGASSKTSIVLGLPKDTVFLTAAEGDVVPTESSASTQGTPTSQFTSV
jgi:hypothetical protein